VTGLVWLTVPFMVLALATMAGIPFWLTVKRPETPPDHAEARAHHLARARRAHVAAVASEQAAGSGLSLARRHAAARAAVPGREHSGHGRSARPCRVTARG
jgi:hypothetical protein